MKKKNEIRPQPGGQWEYFTRNEFEVLFGGQAGPGKSWSLIINALGLQYQQTELGMPAISHPEYRAVLFRRKTTQFTKLIDEGKKYYTGKPFLAEFIQKRTGDPGPSFNFPSGAKIFICHMEMEQNKEDHQGQEYHFIGFDELTQFTLTQYLYLFSRARSAIPHLKSRVHSTTNPTGSGLIWVKKRFIRNGNFKLEPKKRYYFIPDANNEPADNPTGILTTSDNPDAKSRVFIPGRLEENKILMESDPSYRANIMQMGSKMEKALLHGDWDAFGGDFFDELNTSKDGHCIDPFKIPKEWALEGSLDPGYSSPCSFGLQARDFNGHIYRLFTYYVRKQSPEDHAKAILERIKAFPYTDGRMPTRIVAGHDAWAKRDRYAISANELTFADVFSEYNLHLTRANISRVPGWWVWKMLIRQMKWFYFDGYNDSLIEEMTSAEDDENNPEDIKGRGNDITVADHALDECRYGNMSIYIPEQKEKPKPEGDPFLVDEKIEYKEITDDLGDFLDG